METARFQGGQVRMAGSLETSGRQYARNKRIEIERETSSFYDELFAPTPSSAAAANQQQQKQQNKNKGNPISPSNNRLYKSTNDFNADNSSDEFNRASPPRRVPINLRHDASRDSDLESSGNWKNRSPRNFKFKNETKSSKALSNRTNSNDLITSRSVTDHNEAQNRSPDRSTTRNSSPDQPRSDDEDNRSRRKSMSKRDMSSKLSKKRDSVVRPRSNVRNTNQNDDDDDDLEEPLPPNDYSLSFFREVNDFEFLFKPAPRGVLIQTCIRVQANMMSADEYEVIFEDFPDRRSPLLKSQSKTAAGVFYSVNALTPNSGSGGSSKKIGKVESTFSKKKYMMSVIDLGSDSREADYEDKPKSTEAFELIYSNRVIADDKPKDIKVKLMDAPSRRNDSRDSGNATTLVSKKPKLDEKTKLFQLDFRGRARFASTSNMQLVLSGDVNNDSAPVVFQLGKLEKHLFAMDFSYPLSMVTAFGIALSALSRG